MSAMADGSAARVRPPRTPKCTRCRNHGLLVPVRGHSGHCGWKLCNCSKCALITERHKIMAADKLLPKPGNLEPAPKDGHGKAGTPERSGNVLKSLAREESTDLKRKRMSPTRISASEAIKRSSAAILTGPPMYPSEYLPTLDYFEKETTRMYLGCPSMYHYPAFPIGFPPSGFRSTLMSPPPLPAAPPVFPFRGLRPPCCPLQNGMGDFYYPPIPHYMPPEYLPGLHYMPPTVPMNINIMAEPKKSFSGQTVPDNQSLKIASERSETPARNKTT
ncbi:doublesex- and mab-3-related transcription factor B1 [Leptodactylus fuscus]|uniref:doublesex- and mab-3-related transcription factor B1 n=1 Tax=Leptodactylus fuscus TaxID=238119 RepID=UPI003F4EDC74